MDVQLNYDEHFKFAMKKISGFLKTRLDEGTAQAFKIARSKDSGLIELRWQPRASLTEPWLGVDGQVDSAGFCLQKWSPLGHPAVVPPRPVMEEKRRKQMASFKMRDVLKAEHCEEAFDWIQTVAKEAKVPLLVEHQETRVAGAMGRLCDIGAGDRKVMIQVIDEKALARDMADGGKNFWACPKLSAEMMAEREARIQKAIAKYNRVELANVRYMDGDGDIPECGVDQKEMVDDSMLNNLTEANTALRKKLKDVRKQLKDNKVENAKRILHCANQGGGAVVAPAAAPAARPRKKKKKRRRIVVSEADDDIIDDNDEWLPRGEASKRAADEVAEVDEEPVPAVVIANPARPDSDDGARGYTVREILKHRAKQDGSLEYLVWWDGYARGDATWEPFDNFDSPMWIEEYHKALDARLVEEKAERARLELESIKHVPKGAAFATLEEKFQSEVQNLPPRRLGARCNLISSSVAAVVPAVAAGDAAPSKENADVENDEEEETEEHEEEEEEEEEVKEGEDSKEKQQEAASPSPPPSPPSSPPSDSAAASLSLPPPITNPRKRKQIQGATPEMEAGLKALNAARNKRRR
jgi:hypothetical protein